MFSIILLSCRQKKPFSPSPTAVRSFYYAMDKRTPSIYINTTIKSEIRSLWYQPTTGLLETLLVLDSSTVSRLTNLRSEPLKSRSPLALAVSCRVRWCDDRRSSQCTWTQTVTGALCSCSWESGFFHTAHRVFCPSWRGCQCRVRAETPKVISKTHVGLALDYVNECN